MRNNSFDNIVKCELLMIIIHCMRKKTWEEIKDNDTYGGILVKTEGFIHCSSIQNFWRIAPNFTGIKETLVLLCIDTDKIIPEIKWEDGDKCGREYPHIYGELNLDSVIGVLPFLRDSKGEFVLNKEFEKYL